MTFGLNLLPRETKRIVAIEETWSLWRSGLLLTVVVGLMTSGLLFGIEWLLQQRIVTLTDQVATQRQLSNQKGVVDITLATNQLNHKIDLLTAALVTPRPWPATITTVLESLPNDVTITNLTIDGTGQVTISGLAKTRAAFLELQATMATSTVLQNASTTDTASKRENLPFTYTAILAPSI